MGKQRKKPLTHSKDPSVRAVGHRLGWRGHGVQTPVAWPSSVVIHRQLHAAKHRNNNMSTLAIQIFYIRLNFEGHFLFFYFTCPSILRALADTRGLRLITQASFTR